MAYRTRTVTREVRSEDPSLSEEANRLLTGELREAIGRDEVELPEEAAAHVGEHAGDHAAGSRLRATLLDNRVLVAISLAVLVTIGVIFSLATGSWWMLAVACGVHALGTLLVAGFAINMTTQVEHVDPSVAARLEAAGVADPDRALGDLIADYAGAEGGHGAAEVVSTGNNDNRADPDSQPARRAVEQRTVMTPSASGSSPAGSGSVIGLMPVAVVAGLLVVTVASAIGQGGWVWAVPAIVWGAASIWLFLVLRVDGRAEERAAADDRALGGGPDRPHGDVGVAGRTRLLPATAVAVAGVVGFCLLVALLMTSV